MTTKEAWSIIGNQPKWAIRNMVQALKLMTWRNTNEEWRRLEAAKICLRTRNPRYE